MSELEKGIELLTPLKFTSTALVGDAVYRNGKLFGCVTGVSLMSVTVVLDKDAVPAFTSLGKALEVPLKVLSVEITQEQIDRKEFQIFPRDPVPEFPDDPKWKETEIPF